MLHTESWELILSCGVNAYTKEAKSFLKENIEVLDDKI